jgi:DNA-binding PadR family transcriptional regulator
MSLLAILYREPSYGLEMKREFDHRTGDVWSLNVGQVYTTLDRLVREGLVLQVTDGGAERQRVYEITSAGREALDSWLLQPADGSPARDALVLKLVIAARHPTIDAAAVIQAERRGAVELLQQYARLNRQQRPDDDLGWLFLLDSLIFNAEAKVRWLDACEARLGRGDSSQNLLPSVEPIEQGQKVNG